MECGKMEKYKGKPQYPVDGVFSKQNKPRIKTSKRLSSQDQSELDDDGWDSLPDIWINKAEVMPKSKKGGTMPHGRSASLSDLLEEGGGDIRVGKISKPPKMSRDHWEKGRMRQKCNGCQRQIPFVFKRHHCRMCGKIFCQNCSQFKRRLSVDLTPNPDGDLQRVCLYCIKDDDDGAIGYAKSWTKDFINMRSAAHARKFPVEKEPELKLLCEIPPVCRPVVDLFLGEITKTKQPIVKVKLKNAVKAAKRDSYCSECGRDLFVPKDRKKCVVCDDIFCSNCSTKTLVVYYPKGTVQQSEIEKGKVQPTMNIMAPGVDVSTTAELWRNYRTCKPCEKHLDHVLSVFHFNSRLQDYHHELMDLGRQILATLDRALESKAQEIKLDHSLSMENLDQVINSRSGDFPRSQSDVGVLSRCEAKMAEERVTQKLFSRYWDINACIRTRLKPVTQTQQRLHRHILAASSSFYSDKRWHFRVRYDSTVSSTSEDE